MRVAEVIGTVTLSRRLADVPPGRFLIVRPLGGSALSGAEIATSEPVVSFDEIGPGLGSRVAISEGSEATAPFSPKLVPVDVYCAAILDNLSVERST